MFKRIIKMLMIILLVCAILGLLVLLVPRLVTAAYAHGKIYPPADVPVRRVAIVFGAGLTRGGKPTPVLVDRVTAAANLYFAGKVEKLLMSGDNRFINYNEPEAMRQLALSLGVPTDAIVRDYAGRRTYDTCYRAKAIFGVTQAILVTQAFHMPRALYLCNHLGVDSVGVDADLEVYRKSALLYWNLRELPATTSALWDLYIGHPLPVLGKYEPIFP
ncbi:MAG TPA: ElyC/SanA/YdcF family protein [Anaerolineales bacterium]|nr:ElyC/SanA/YdcF family protein [Anaerolineales bacterium]